MDVQCAFVAAKRRAFVAPFGPTWAARCEGAAPGSVGGCGWLPSDRLEPMSDRTDDLGHGGEEGVRIRMAPIAIEVVGRRCLDDAAGIHYVDPVGVARHDAEIVRDEKQRPAQSAGKVSEK